MPRREFEMTKKDLKKLLEASKPVPYMVVVGGMPPTSPQEKANRVWAELGAKMGFKWRTARPVPGKDQRFFTAEPLDDDTDD